MSAPESTSSKGRPSLLSETAPGAGDSSSRILASLEGRAVAQPLPRRRPKKPLMIAALAVIGFGALGAWQLQRGQQGESAAPVAQSSAVGAGAGKAQAAAGGASAAVVAAAANASGVSATAGGASTPQAAVIVADDSTRADTSAASASGPSGNGSDSDRLSRALASGSAPTQSPAMALGAQPADKSASTAVASAGSASGTNAAAKRAAPAVASRTDRQTAKSRHPEKVASAHASKRGKGHASSVKDDPDADLLAALVARTKPYEPKASSANAPKGAGGGATTKAARPATDAHRASLADQVKACDKGNFFEAQACRWRVCSDHWGTDPACPSTASAAQTH